MEETMNGPKKGEEGYRYITSHWKNDKQKHQRLQYYLYEQHDGRMKRVGTTYNEDQAIAFIYYEPAPPTQSEDCLSGAVSAITPPHHPVTE